MLTRRLILAGSAATPLLGVLSPAFASSPPNLIVRGNRLFLDIVINGHPARALLDSAAETSFVDTAFAQKIGLKPQKSVGVKGSGGDADAQLADGVVIDALDLRLGPLSVAMLDLSDVGNRLLHGPLPVVLGRELFDAARISVNIAQGRIGVVPGNVEPAGVKLKLTREKGIESFPASLEGHAPVQTAFDLGNGTEVLVSENYAKETRILTDGRTIVEKSGGGIGGAKRRQTFTIRFLEIAGRRIDNVAAAIDAGSSATTLNVGVDVLRHFDIVTDYPENLLWLRPV